MSGARASLLAIAAASSLSSISGCRHRAPPAADCLNLEVPAGPVGFDVPFTISARLDCAELRGGRIRWRQLEGPTLRELRDDRSGFLLTARLPPVADVLGGAAPWGVVPFSPRTRGEVLLEATWTGDGGPSLSRSVRVAGAARSRGLPNAPVGARLYLGGDGWTISSRPPASAASLDGAGGLTSLLPDVSGSWRLVDRAGHALALRTGRYDETPLDCGRGGCHDAATAAAAGSPMTTVLARGLVGAPGESAFGPGYPDCAVACHATGEPGVADGGFAHVALELGATHELHRRWEELPRALRRMGGVGCLACHGPGAIPEPAARWGVLRADVCAVCHDAPPRYGHVAAWRESRMAHADRNARARTEPACARCHTTWGFLQSADRRPPDEVGAVGITCAACHAVHDRNAVPELLLRQPPVPAILTGGAHPLPALPTSQVCLGCHAPDAGAPAPSSSAAALWLGRGGLDPATGRPLEGGVPHAVAGGCVGCHRGGPQALARGAGHAFRVAPAVCTPCHAQPPPPSDIVARARRLWDAARPPASDAAAAGAPPHAATNVHLDRRTPRGRATWDLLLVLEDPAAAAHNAPYARALLAAAERALAGGRP